MNHDADICLDGAEIGQRVAETEASSRPGAMVFVVPNLVCDLVRTVALKDEELDLRDVGNRGGGDDVEKIVDAFGGCETEKRVHVQQRDEFLNDLLVDEQHG